MSHEDPSIKAITPEHSEKINKKSGRNALNNTKKTVPAKEKSVDKALQQKENDDSFRPSQSRGSLDEGIPSNKGNSGSLKGFKESFSSEVRNILARAGRRSSNETESTESGESAERTAAQADGADEKFPGRIDKEHPWDNTRYSLEGARNSHRTNTKEQFDDALKQNTQWLESDVRREIDHPERMETRHDEGQESGDNLPLSDWLNKGLETGRGLKLDIKDQDRTPQILDEVEKAGAPDERMMFNLGSSGIDRYGKEIRRRFPNSILAINPPSGGMTRQNLEKMVRQADETGGPTTFVLREDEVTDEAIKALKGHGTISVWNSPGFALPGDTSPEERAENLHRRGVNGLIDLRPDKGPLDLIGDGIDKLQSLF